MPLSLITSENKDLKSIEKFRFIHNFIPHPHTKKRAKLLSHWALTAYCIGTLVLFLTLKTVPHAAPGVLGYASSIKIDDLLLLTNKRREAAGLDDLKINYELSAAAQNKANDMFKKGYWAHVSPDGVEPWDFILAQKYDYSYAGENLAKNFGDSKEVVDAWYNSPSHKENLLNTHYVDVGFAVVNGTLDGYETTLVVQMFGRPRVAELAAVDTGDLAPATVKSAQIVPTIAEAPTTVVNVPQVGTAGKVATSEVFPLLNIASLSKIIGLVFLGYLSILLLLDIWYSHIKGIPKVTGHTLAHLAFLLLAFLGVWFALVPGKIL